MARNYDGVVRITLPEEAVGGVFPAIAYLGNSTVPVASASHAVRATAYANCVAALSNVGGQFTHPTLGAVDNDLRTNPKVIEPPPAVRFSPTVI